jgi:hypothetical protein
VLKGWVGDKASEGERLFSDCVLGFIAVGLNLCNLRNLRMSLSPLLPTHYNIYVSITIHYSSLCGLPGRPYTGGAEVGV